MPRSWHGADEHQHHGGRRAAERARRVGPNTTDAALVDAALEAVVARHRREEIDAQYAVSDEIPLDTPDEWGDLQSWHEAIDKRRRATHEG